MWSQGTIDFLLLVPWLLVLSFVLLAVRSRRSTATKSALFILAGGTAVVGVLCFLAVLQGGM